MPRTEYREHLKTGRSEKLSEELILCFSETSLPTLVEPLSYTELPGEATCEDQQSSQTLPGPVESVRADKLLSTRQCKVQPGLAKKSLKSNDPHPTNSTGKGGQRQWAQKASSKNTGPQTLLWPTWSSPWSALNHIKCPVLSWISVRTREVQRDLQGILISC